MRKKLILFGILCTLSATSFGQIKGNYTQENPDISRMNIVQNNHLYFEAPQFSINNNLPTSDIIDIKINALQNVDAANYVAVFNLSQVGKTAEEATALVNDRIHMVQELLLKKGIPKDDIVSDVISFIPVYEVEVEKKLFSKKYVEVPTGFELQQNLHIGFKDINVFEDILAACAKNEIYNLVKVDYFIENIEGIYKSLQDQALKLILEKKKYYEALGFNLTTYKPQFAEQKFCFSPKNFYKSYLAYNSISIEALDKPKGITTAKKQTSYFYQPLSGENFDTIVNPFILEPVIQVVVQAHLQLIPIPKEKETPKPEKEYFLISSGGAIDIKKINGN